MGRAKQPIALLTAKGNKHLSKAEIEHRKKTEVKADTDNVNPPETLPQRLHEKFYYYSEQLVDIGIMTCLLYTSPSPRDRQKSRMPSSA